MKIKTVCLSFLLISVSPSLFAAEDFKGNADPHDLTAGVMLGLGSASGSAGLGVVGVIGKKILNQGFAPEINNQVFIEAEVGPLFRKGDDAFSFSTHLRWDFQKDERLTPYAIGGIAGNDDWNVFPRFGIGTFWKPSPSVPFLLRAEVSHEFVGIGVSFDLI